MKKIFIILLMFPWTFAQEEEECDLEEEFTQSFAIDSCRFINRYPSFYGVVNPYFIMEPGWQVILEGEEDGAFFHVEITVLDETEWVDGVSCRVIEEAEYEDGELVEVSRNFFAICTQTNDIYYFGEDVDDYEDGEIVGHGGAWRSGVNGATAGLYMPGTPLLGSRFYQEVAPEVALDRAEIQAIEDVEVGDMLFENALIIEESDALDDPCDTAEKIYAPYIGIIVDETLEIVQAEFIFKLPPNIPFKTSN